MVNGEASHCTTHHGIQAAASHRSHRLASHVTTFLALHLHGAACLHWSPRVQPRHRAVGTVSMGYCHSGHASCHQEDGLMSPLSCSPLPALPFLLSPSFLSPHPLVESQLLIMASIPCWRLRFAFCPCAESNFEAATFSGAPTTIKVVSAACDPNRKMESFNPPAIEVKTGNDQVGRVPSSSSLRSRRLRSSSSSPVQIIRLNKAGPDRWSIPYSNATTFPYPSWCDVTL